MEKSKSENQKIAHFSKIWDIKSNFGQNMCSKCEKLHCLKYILISFYIFFVSWKIFSGS